MFLFFCAEFVYYVPFLSGIQLFRALGPSSHPSLVVEFYETDPPNQRIPFLDKIKTVRDLLSVGLTFLSLDHIPLLLRTLFAFSLSPSASFLFPRLLLSSFSLFLSACNLSSGDHDWSVMRFRSALLVLNILVSQGERKNPKARESTEKQRKMSVCCVCAMQCLGE